MNEQTSHIRCRPRPQNRNPWYRDRGPSGAEKTLCGDPATDRDMSWAETRWSKSRAFVSCSACIDLRMEQGAVPSLSPQEAKR